MPPTAEIASRLDIADSLQGVIDPEIGLDIVTLGLIYDIHVEGQVIEVYMTMTTPACPMSNYIKQEVGRALSRIEGVRRIIVELVWDPAWSPAMMDPDVRRRRFPSYR